MTNTILIVEDDDGIRETLQEILSDRGFLVDAYQDGLQLLSSLKKTLPDLLLLDLGLPGIDGESLSQEIHKNYPSLPIIILTAKISSEDATKNLSMGAVDYVRKPFDVDELIARMKVHLKSKDEELLRAGDIQMNTKTMEVHKGKTSITLTPHEFKLLEYLLQNKGQVLSREMILNRVWQYTYDVDSRVVDVYIGYLRKKIDGSSKKSFITGLRGFGYSIKEG